MKKGIVFSLCTILVLAVVMMVSCDSDSAVVQSTSHSEAIGVLGDVSTVYSADSDKGIVFFPTSDESVSRYVTGQKVKIYGYNAIFEADLVEYNSLDPQVVKYVESLELANALMHQSYPGFTSSVIDPDKTYVEFATYTDVETDKVICHEVRVFTGDFMDTFNTGSYYARSVTFSPDMTVDVNKHVNVFTGEASSYRIPQGSAQSTTTVKNSVMKETDIRKDEFNGLGDINRVFARFDGEEIDLIHMFGGDDTTAECYLVELNSLSENAAAKFAATTNNGLHQREWPIVSEEGKEYVEVVLYYTKSTSESSISYRLRAEKMPNTKYGYYTKCISSL